MPAERLTPEERAVIEAAEMANKSFAECQPTYHSGCTIDAATRLSSTVRALRESREKWRADGVDMVRSPDVRLSVYSCGLLPVTDVRDRVLALLNAGERALAGEATDGRRTP